MNVFRTSNNQIYPIEEAINPSLSNASSNNNRKRCPINLASFRQLRLPATSFPEENVLVARSQKLEDIFLNKCSSNTYPLYSIGFGFCGIVLCVIFTAVYTCWPQHNIIENSEYWYESIFGIIFGWEPIAAASIVVNSFFFLGINGKKMLTSCFVVYVIGTLNTCLSSFLCYIFWSQLGGYRMPMPFQGYAVCVCTWHVMCITLWFQYPKEWRSDPIIRKKILFGILYLNMAWVIEITYKGLGKLFLLTQNNAQYLLVPILILLREFHAWILCHLGERVSGCSDLSVETVATHWAAVRHTVFLSVILGSVATDITAYLILGIDFLINICFCLFTIWCSKTESEAKRKMHVKCLLYLAMNESVEFIMPIAYCIVLLMAYFGPNAEIIGDVKNSSWHFKAITNLYNTISWHATMFFVDFGSMVVSFCLLQGFCKLNLAKMHLQLVHQMWYILAVGQSYLVVEVGINSLIHHSGTNLEFHFMFVKTFFYLNIHNISFYCLVLLATTDIICKRLYV